MKTFLISGVSALALAGMALAVPFEDADTDGDGSISLSEIQAIDPATTEAEFTLYDVDLDGGLDEDEYAAWRAATQRDAQPDPFAEPMEDDVLTDDELWEEPTTVDPLTDELPTEAPAATADPRADDAYAPEEPQELEDPERNPFSGDKSFDDEERKDEYARDESDEHEFDAAFGRDDVDYDSDADGDEIIEQLNEAQAEELESEAEEDGDESEPWK